MFLQIRTLPSLEFKVFYTLVFTVLFSRHFVTMLLCSKYDREHDFDVILGLVVLCRKLRWICHKHSNDVVRQVEIPGKSTFFLPGISFMSLQRLDYMDLKWFKNQQALFRLHVSQYRQRFHCQILILFTKI